MWLFTLKIKTSTIYKEAHYGLDTSGYSCTDELKADARVYTKLCKPKPEQSPGRREEVGTLPPARELLTTHRCWDRKIVFSRKSNL